VHESSYNHRICTIHIRFSRTLRLLQSIAGNFATNDDDGNEEDVV